MLIRWTTMVIFVVASRCPGQAGEPPFADLREGPITSETIASYRGSPERLEALFDWMWADGSLDGVEGIHHLLAPGSADEVAALCLRFRRAALLHPRAGLRRLALRHRPSSAFEAAARVESLRRETDDRMIAAHFRTGCSAMGPEWIGVLLDHCGRDLDDPRAAELVYHLAAARRRRGRVSGLSFERVSPRGEGGFGSRGLPVAPQPITPTKRRIEAASMMQRRDCRVLVGYLYDGSGSPAARLLLDGATVDEWELERGKGHFEMWARPRVRLASRFEAPFDCEKLQIEVDEEALGSFHFFGCAFVAPNALDVRSHGAMIPLVRDGRPAVEVDGAEATAGWASALVVSGDEARITFEVPRDCDLDRVRSLHLDHWSSGLTGWRTELNGAPFLAFISRPMPRPARTTRLRLGTIRPGRNVLVLRREQGEAPLHLGTMWLWP